MNKEKIKIPKLPSWFYSTTKILLFLAVFAYLFFPQLRTFFMASAVVFLFILLIDHLSLREFDSAYLKRISGDKVKAATDLKPKGKIKYNGEIVDAISENNERIDCGSPCEIVSMQKGDYVVRVRQHE